MPSQVGTTANVACAKAASGQANAKTAAETPLKDIALPLSLRDWIARCQQ
jgi:hypothetical protein